MKKWLIGITGFIVIIVAIYIFIPSILVVSKISPVKCSINGVNRFLIDETRWTGWWPLYNGKKPAVSTDKKVSPIFNYNGFLYHLSQKYYNSVEVTIFDNEFLPRNSRINILKVSGDSVILEWTCQFSASLNPVKRITDYRKAVRISRNMTDILKHFKSFLEKNENVYGVNIHQIISKDSTLITTKRITSTYPSTGQIYEMIAELKKHIAEEGASINNVPMLNVRFTPGQQYETMVAIPVNRMLRETPTIKNKRFVPWKTLVGDVKGGVSTIQRAQQQMLIYIDDHQRNAMGIPFELLTTDRSREPDTLKWITRICQAVS